MRSTGTLRLHTSAVRAADVIVALLPSVGGPGPLLLGIDGRSGTGKTTVADTIRRVLTGERVSERCVHMDELYAGWQGLAAALPSVRRQVLEPLRSGTAASYRRWDWARNAWEPEPATIGRHDVVVVEGVGAVHADPAAYDLTVWLSAPTPVRRRRALARDAEVFAPHWERWADQEDDLFGPGGDDPPPWPVDVHLRLVADEQPDEQGQTQTQGRP